jgi:sialate O-acetylesterase
MLATFTKKQLRKLLASLFFLLAFVPSALAAFTISPIFSSNMVLQRGTTVPVFGTADAGTTVTVQFLGQSRSGVADASGKWRVDLSSMAANATPSTMTVTSGAATITLTGVQVGEVWLCSGQSNMGWPLVNANNSASTISSAGSHNIRLFRMTAGNGPSTTTWQISNSSTVGNFSAVGYWMGLELSQWFGNVPVGLIQATHDGTSIDHWQHTSSGIGDDYDAMVKSIQPFAIKGVAWYQGESNGGDLAYRTKLANMIREWRTDWNLPTLPFGIIQLAYRSGWNAARNAQLEVADSEPNCFLVVIRDLPGGQLHPTEKKPVGIRTAIGARGMVYGDNITYSGSIRDIPNSYVSGNKVILNWKHLGNGLFTDNGLAPGEFKVATATGQFKTATAVIVGNTVEVSNSTVPIPARVQYSYSSVGNLYTRVNVLTEGGTVVVDRLKVSEFEIAVSPRTGAASAPDALLEESKAPGLSVFPNPAAGGQFSISLNGVEAKGQLSLTLTDAAGRIAYSRTDKARDLVTVKSSLKPGIYMLRVADDSGVLFRQKLVIR